MLGTHRTWRFWVASGVLVGVLAGSAAYTQYARADAIQNPAVRAQLQAQLEQLNTEIDTLNGNLQNTQKQQTSLERDIQIVNDQIKRSQLEITRRNITIQQLSLGIQDKQDVISGLNDKLGDELNSLSSIMRQTNQLDTQSTVVVLLTARSISEFFADIDQFAAVNDALQKSFSNIQDTKSVNLQEKADLQSQLDDETQLKQVQQLQQQQLQGQEDLKNQILAATKGQEKSYQKLIASKQQTAAQIRAALFNLSGAKAIQFGQALQYAQAAEAKTGVRAAFVLGLITEESDLGQNVGRGSYQADMHPTRDVPIFLAITRSLGINPNEQPVSKKAWYGWGGAMGPAQFLPSTWALYTGYTKPNWAYNAAKDRIGRLTGNQPPSPWSPQDSIMAAALYLADSGADSQTSSGEFRAAMCYLAGCGNTNKKDLQFYGRQVAALADKYQCQIDVVSGNANRSCPAL